MSRKIQLLLALALGTLLALAPAAAQTAKKVVRIHTAGPNDVNVETTRLAVEFAN